MTGLSTLLDTPEKILVAVGTACLIVAIIAPSKVPFIGGIAWTGGKRSLLGVVGGVLLACGISLKWLPLELIFTNVGGDTAIRHRSEMSVRS
jgi:hypothetical protein